MLAHVLQIAIACVEPLVAHNTDGDRLPVSSESAILRVARKEQAFTGAAGERLALRLTRGRRDTQHGQVNHGVRRSILRVPS